MHQLDIETLRALYTWRVQGDGNCLWYALAGGALLRDLSLDQLKALDEKGRVTELAFNIRRRVCRALSDGTGSLKEEYLPFFAAGELGADVEDAQSYVKGLQDGRVLGGALEIKLAAELLNAAILVLDVQDSKIFVVAYGSGAPILLLRTGMHFDTLSTRKPRPSSAPARSSVT